jgi:hypothetical protein
VPERPADSRDYTPQVASVGAGSIDRGDPLSPSYYLIVTALLSLFALVAIQRRQTLARGLTEGFEMQKQLV